MRLLTFIFLLFTIQINAQNHPLKIIDPSGKAIPFSTVSVYTKGGVLTLATDSTGQVSVQHQSGGIDSIHIKALGFAPLTLYKNFERKTVILQPSVSALADVTVQSTLRFISQSAGKTVIRPDASAVNQGTTIAEIFEQAPGISVDRNGNISMKGRNGVSVFIDDKRLLLNGQELVSFLNSINTSTVASIEFITNPPAKYDASGNAGIINIRMKKNVRKGTNAVVSLSAGMGQYAKANNSVSANYKTGSSNYFLSYSHNYNRGHATMYALRHYFDNVRNVTATLDQPTDINSFNNNHTLRLGLDRQLDRRTTLSVLATGVAINRKIVSPAVANWINSNGGTDSSLLTDSRTRNYFRNLSVGIGLKRELKGMTLTADADASIYDIANNVVFVSEKKGASSNVIVNSGDIPSELKIFSAQLGQKFAKFKGWDMETGLKTTYTYTDNDAAFTLNVNNSGATADASKTNHFIYDERIHAAFISGERKIKAWTIQGGVRYEVTSYKARQLTNASGKDSVSTRNYHGLFPSASITFQADSNHSFTLAVSKRIDRPPFQQLNPFVNIINKYTVERGNPRMRPQITWNAELTHQFKELVTTSLGYSYMSDYFSQIFVADPNEILVYTHGNVGKVQTFTVSTNLSLTPAKFWSFNTTGIYTYKSLNGYDGISYYSDIHQLSFNLNNQFNISRKFNAEISGSYTGYSRNDLQEKLYPFGQVSAGISLSILKNRGTVRLSARDIFHTQWMEGLTDFPAAEEYFILRRDTRVLTLGANFRLGKSYKAIKRTASNQGEAERVQF